MFTWYRSVTWINKSYFLNHKVCVVDMPKIVEFQNVTPYTWENRNSSTRLRALWRQTRSNNAIMSLSDEWRGGFGFERTCCHASIMTVTEHGTLLTDHHPTSLRDLSHTRNSRTKTTGELDLEHLLRNRIISYFSMFYCFYYLTHK